jgi:cytosine/adenosine deaminase-related metal-dependent hydrolase
MVTIVGPDRPHVDAAVRAYQESGLRVVLGLQFGDRASADAIPFWREELPPEILAQVSAAPDVAPTQRLIEELLSGPAEPRLTWALAPSAPQRCSEDVLRWVAATASRFRSQVFTHVYEAKSQAILARRAYRDDGGTFIGHLERVGLLGPQLTIAHGVWIADDEVQRFGGAGANLAFNPMSNLKLLNGVAPIVRYAAAGAGLALGCDNCSGNDVQNIFESMKMFALYWGLQTGAGETGAAKEAFRAATLGGARALGLADEVGAIRPGFRADLSLISLSDPAFVPLNSAVRQLVYGGSPRAVDTVLVGGEAMVVHGRPTRVDDAQLVPMAEEARALLAADFAAVTARNAAIIDELLRVHERTMGEPLDLDRYRLN